MLLGPIFRVEAVTTARRRRYFALRVLYAGLMLFLLWTVYESASAIRYGQTTTIQQAAIVSTSLFTSFSWLQLFAILGVGPALAVGTISTERERRTIEYLFTTDLSNAEIVLGKTIARLALLTKLLLVGLPILFICRLLGGIPAELLAGSFIIAASTGLFVTAISICVSVWSERSRDATVRVYLIIAIWLLLPLILFGVLAVNRNTTLLSDYVSRAKDFFDAINPVRVLVDSMGSRFATGANFDFTPVLEMAAWHVGLSVVLLALAVAAVRRVHLRESSKGAGKKEQIARLPIARRIGWRPQVSDNAMIWKEAFAGTSKTRLGLAGFVASALIVVSAMGFTIYFFLRALDENHWRNDYQGFLAFITGAVGSGILLLLGARAAGLISQEKERDTWLSLLATPLTGREIMVGKMMGNLYAARWAFVLVAFAWVLGVILKPPQIISAVFVALTFWITVCYATNLGLLYSLRSKTTLRAMGLTLATLIFVGGGYLMCCCPIMAIGGAGGPDEAFMLGFAPCIPFLLGLPAGFSELNYSREALLVVAYGIGVIGYGIAAAILLQIITTEFDSYAGRCTMASRRRPPSNIPGAAASGSLPEAPPDVENTR